MTDCLLAVSWLPADWLPLEEWARLWINVTILCGLAHGLVIGFLMVDMAYRDLRAWWRDRPRRIHFKQLERRAQERQQQFLKDFFGSPNGS